MLSALGLKVETSMLASVMVKVVFAVTVKSEQLFPQSQQQQQQVQGELVPLPQPEGEHEPPQVQAELVGREPKVSC